MMLNQGDVLRRIFFVNRNVFAALIKRSCFICKKSKEEQSYDDTKRDLETTLQMV